MKFSIGSGGYDIRWNGASHNFTQGFLSDLPNQPKPKRAIFPCFGPSFNGKMGPKSKIGFIFHWTKYFSAGQNDSMRQGNHLEIDALI